MYKETSDNELIYMIREDENNIEILLEKYKPLIIKICNKYFKIANKLGFDMDDLLQIANISLINSIKYYRDNKNTLFYTYIKCCIENNIKTELKKENSNRKKTLNYSLSLDEIIEGTDQTLLDIIKDDRVVEPIDLLILEEKEIEYVKYLNSLPLEIALVVEMKNNGFSTNDISKFLQIDKQTIIKYTSYAKRRLCLN